MSHVSRLSKRESLTRRAHRILNSALPSCSPCTLPTLSSQRDTLRGVPRPTSGVQAGGQLAHRPIRPLSYSITSLLPIASSGRLASRAVRTEWPLVDGNRRRMHTAAVPGVLNPVVLLRKNKHGDIVPWQFEGRHKDGSLRVDIPLQSLHLLFNTSVGRTRAAIQYGLTHWTVFGRLAGQPAPLQLLLCPSRSARPTSDPSSRERCAAFLCLGCRWATLRA